MFFIFNINTKIKTGFSTVEILIASAVISVSMFALLSVGQKSVELSRVALDSVRASFLLEEGAEVVKIIRSDDWNNILDLEEDTDYYFVYSGGVWSFSETPNSIESFTRKVFFEDVYRDNNDDIASSGFLDSLTKRVTVSVSWDDV